MFRLRSLLSLLVLVAVAALCLGKSSSAREPLRLFQPARNIGRINRNVAQRRVNRQVARAVNREVNREVNFQVNRAIFDAAVLNRGLFFNSAFVAPTVSFQTFAPTSATAGCPVSYVDPTQPVVTAPTLVQTTFIPTSTAAIFFQAMRSY